MSVLELVSERRSVRTFDGRALEEEDVQKISSFASAVKNPYGIPVKWVLLSASTSKLNVPVVTGADTYLAGVVADVPHAEEAFGYAFEQVVLYAQSLGIGTTIIAGTMDREGFERAISLKEGEVMPCVTPLGYPAKKMSFREQMMRKGVKADVRLPFEKLFFNETFETPLSKEEAGTYGDLLELVRLAPSAVNRQPWRIVKQGSQFHFFETKAKGFDDGWDIQKVDLGIALSHFACGLDEQEIQAEFVLEEPELSLPENTQYIATYRIG
ncbi:MAG: hypothetical protein IJ225_11080 [Solobacterium sp.]|nr:hypothetical protein [Solobacterium sp.]